MREITVIVAAILLSSLFLSGVQVARADELVEDEPVEGSVTQPREFFITCTTISILLFVAAVTIGVLLLAATPIMGISSWYLLLY